MSLRAVTVFLQAHEFATMARHWDELMDALDEWRRTDDPTRAQRIIEQYQKRMRRRK
jgi:hypothetical protein